MRGERVARRGGVCHIAIHNQLSILWRKQLVIKHNSQVNYEEFRAALGKRIRQVRVAQERSQEDVSGLDMAVATYSKIELGKHGTSLISIFRIAQSLGVHPSELFDFPVDWARRSTGKKAH